MRTSSRRRSTPNPERSGARQAALQPQELAAVLGATLDERVRPNAYVGSSNTPPILLQSFSSPQCALPSPPKPPLHRKGMCAAWHHRARRSYVGYFSSPNVLLTLEQLDERAAALEDAQYERGPQPDPRA